MVNELGFSEVKYDVVVLGMGNLLRRDEGLGIRAMESLDARYDLPETVQLVDGGTMGLELISYLEGAKHLLVLDAILTGGLPGTFLRISNEEVPAYFGMRTSPHEVGLPDLIAITRLKGTEPSEVVVMGLHPETIELGWDLSETVAGQIETLIAAAVDQIIAWGIEIHPRSETVFS